MLKLTKGQEDYTYVCPMKGVHAIPCVIRPILCFHKMRPKGMMQRTLVKYDGPLHAKFFAIKP